jgi:tRNA ligase
VAVVWDIDSQPYHRLLRICSERVVARGDNHQTLRPDPTAEAEHEAIVGQFLRNFTTPDPALFDRMIEVKVDDAPREAIRKVVDGFVGLLGLQQPSDEAIDQALKAAEGYKVTTPYHAPAKISKAVRYFGLAPEIDITALVDEGIAGLSKDLVDSAKAFFEDLKIQKRVAAKPHVTLAHEKNVEAEKDATGGDAAATAPPGPQETLWNTCKALAEYKVPQMFDFNLTHLVWDDRVMALVLDDLHPQPTSAPDGEDDAMQITLDLPREVKAGLHVTVGTRTEEISAFEARGITRRARKKMMQRQSEGEADEAVEGGGKVRWAKIGPLHGEGRVRGMS